MFKILLVEDEYWQREALKLVITQKFSDVKIVGEAEFGIDAVQLFEKHNPDMVFLDIRIPGIDGIEVFRIIKSKNKNVKVIFVTAYDMVHNFDNYGNPLGDEYLLKPISEKAIIDVIIKHRNKNANFETRKELVKQIIKKDYKQSKKVLVQLLDSMLSNNDNDDYISICREISLEIINTLDKTDLKDQGLYFYDEEYLKDIISISDYYCAKRWVFKVLDDIFELIVRNKSRNKIDSLNMSLNYIEKNLHRRITLEEVAEHINMSPFYLSKIFKKEIHINFVDYITERKMEKARELLISTKTPIMNIALDLGYNEPNYFSKVFRKATGITPSEYRDENFS